MLDPEQVRELPDEIGLVSGDIVVAVNDAPHRFDDLEPVADGRILPDVVRQREVVDCLLPDLVGRLDQLLCVFRRELEPLDEEPDDIAPLGRGELAIGVGNVEQDGSRGEPEGVVLLLWLRLGVATAQHVEDFCDAHGIKCIAPEQMRKLLLPPNPFISCMRTDIAQLGNEANAWIFGISPSLDPEKQQTLLRHVDAFLDDWAAHNVPIRGARELREGAFLIVAADENRERSGCSIDRMFGTLRQLERELGVSILDSTRVFYRDNGTVRAADRSTFRSTANAETIVFDTTAEQLSAIRSGAWERRAADSWHRHLIS
jgi:hypothetical protein